MSKLGFAWLPCNTFYSCMDRNAPDRQNEGLPNVALAFRAGLR
ncbi:hypothetical protein M673_04745 [Aureimonas sp. AU20]|nr:hypothetical protein M673_04745 [Aureimonas sp. AU20]